MSKQTRNSPPITKNDSSRSPVSKLLMGNRPTAVESFVSKIDAISFDGFPPPPNHHHHQQPIIHRSPNHSPPLGLINSPPSNDLSPRLDEFTRDTPTIRQLKTSLRSRLRTDSARNQRLSEDSARSDSSDLLHPSSPNGSPKKSIKPGSFSPRQHSVALSIKSAPSSSSSSRPASARTSANRLSDILPPFTPVEPPRNPSPIITPPCDNPPSASTSSSPLLHGGEKVKSTQLATVSISEGCDSKHSQSSDLTSRPPVTTPTPHTTPSKASTDLPELHIPLTNLQLSPPKLALWSLQAYDSGATLELSDLITNLVILPLHTVLAITRKVPILGRCLDSTPLSNQAEQQNQGILITATQIAMGLILAGGWKIVNRLINCS